MPSYKEKKEKLRRLVQQEQAERIKKIQDEGHQFKDTDAFKRAQKFYKYYVHRVTDFSKLVNMDDLQCLEIQGKKVYKLDSPQGAYLVKNFMSVEEQIQIGFEALNRFIYRPYRTNLDGTNGLYEKQEEMNDALAENQLVQPTEVINENGQILYYFNERIRMANLGYQYDWPHRSYPSSKVPVPLSVTQLGERAVSFYEQMKKQPLQYHGQAVIVNYYKVRDYMIGHLDDGQIDQKNPIFSFCFGLSCVFLMGFPQKQRQPIAIKLESGDLMIMSGYSRICYHGVPRIIENSFTIPPQQQLQFDLKVPKQEKEYKWLNTKKQVLNYYQSHRLNINIRQVYPNQQKKNNQEIIQLQKQQTSEKQ